MAGASAASRRSAPSAQAARELEIDQLREAFRQLWRTLSRLRGRDTHLGGAELSHAQFELLLELYERGELPAGELAAAAHMAPGTVTQMLDNLAASGNVERLRSAVDRRIVVTRLTDAGRAQIEAKRAAWNSRWERALGGLEGAQLKAAAQVLERLAAMVEQAPHEGR